MEPSVLRIAKRVKSGTQTAASYVEVALAQAADKKEYGTLISLTSDRAKKCAAAIDEKIRNGEEAGILAGVPFIAKDNFLTFGGETTAASNILKGFEAPYQATAIEKLEAAGAICIGKANMDAFGHGGSSENSDFGPTFNPADKARVAGGSSGGSAAGVALDIVPFALGTDTGGSVRQPASYCGVVGLKPSYGRISRFGVVAMASSMDVVGVLAKNVFDASIILDVLAGKDERDATTIPVRPDSYIVKNSPKEKKKIGIIKEFIDQLDDAAKEVVAACFAKYRQAGHEIEEISLPSISLSLAIYYVVVPAEISSNLGRYDGIRFGASSDRATNLSEVYTETRTAGFNDENTRRIMIGNYVLSSGYYDAYYRKAQIARTLLIDEFKKAFESYDVLIGPTAPGPAFKFGEKSDPLTMYLMDIMTVSPSLAGLPAISLPCGFVDNMPMGMQVIGAYGDDLGVLNAAMQLEASHG